MNASVPYLVAALLAAALAVAMLVWALRERGRASRAELRLSMIEQSGEHIRAQAAQSANLVADELLKRADESFRNRELLAQQRMESQLKPVAETLAKFEKQVQEIEKARAEDTGGLKAQIASLLQASEATQGETRKLSSALRRGAGVQGRWGEQMLRNVLEMSGLAERYDYDLQPDLTTEEGRRRPDATVKIPGGGLIVIDAKCSLNAFMEAQEAIDDVARADALARHAQSMRSHVTGLSNKAYWDQFRDQTPDYVVMFIPGDGYLAAALEQQPDLLTEAMKKKVVPTTPSTLFALLKGVAYGWRAEERLVGAREAADLGRELYKRLATMGEHVGRMSKSLTGTVEHFNRFVASLESQVLTQAKRFEDLSVDHEGKDIQPIAMVEPTPKVLTKPELLTDDKPALSVVKSD